jgi:hypothetical protein
VADAVIVNAEPTPNPMSMKFTVNRMLIEKRGKTFTKKADAAGLPLFEKIFDAVGDGIASIFCVNTFFTITQNGKIDWNSAIPKVEQVVKTHFAA